MTRRRRSQPVSRLLEKRPKKTRLPVIVILLIWGTTRRLMPAEWRVCHLAYRILPPKCHFSFVKSANFVKKILPRIPNLQAFRHPKIRPFQQCITVTASLPLTYSVKFWETCSMLLAYIFLEKNTNSEQLLFLLGITLWVGRLLYSRMSHG